MKNVRGAIALAMLVALPAGASAEEFSYSYVEATVDRSETRNTAEAPVEEDASGQLMGIAVSWQALDSVYLKGAWSRETKEFSNEVALTPLNLDSTQTVATLGAGYRFEAGEETDIYAEALVIVDFEVEHSVPLVMRSRRGPPTVTTTSSVIGGDGFGAVLGIRDWIDDDLEFEGQLSQIQTRGDVPRTGAEISDTETMLKVGGHYHVGSGVSVGGFLAYSRHTDENFDKIRKVGLSLRYHF